jgi:hypothetical protein
MTLTPRMSLKTTIFGIYCREQKTSGRQCHFKIWLDCHKFKKKSLSDYAHVNKVSKKMTITVIQHDDRHDRKKSHVYSVTWEIE